MVIFDRSYQRWEGDRDRPLATVPVIARAGVRIGVARLFRRKLPALLLTLASFGFFLVLFFLIFFVYWIRTNLDAVGPGLQEMISDPDIVELTSINGRLIFLYMARGQAAFVVLASVLMGSGLVADDRRTNALELYLSRPLGVRDYLMGKFCTVAFFVALVTLIPAVLLVLAQMSVTGWDVAELRRLAGVLGRTLASGAVIVAVPSLLVLTASSLANKARTAAILFVAFLFLSDALAATALQDIFDQDGFYLLSFVFNIKQVMAHLLQVEGSLLGSVPVWQSGAVLAAWCALCAWILRRRVRPVDIVG